MVEEGMTLWPKTCVECGKRGINGTSRCAEHTLPPMSEAERRRRHPYRANYVDAEYRKNRELALERANGRCERCREPHGPDKQVDHIVPVRDGGTNDLTNLQVLCRACTKVKNREDKRARRRDD